MIQTDEGTWYSASDLLNWLGCEHRSTLDSQARADKNLAEWLKAQRSTVVLLMPDAEDGPSFDTPAKARGDQHERAMLAGLEAEGRGITRIPTPTSMSSTSIRNAAEATRAAMAAGAEVIFQAALLDAPWFGFADFLVRVDGVPSDLGDYAYEVRDTKLARHASASALIQMAHYGSIVEKLQGTPPPSLKIWLGTGEEFPWPYADAAPYLFEVRERFMEFTEQHPVTIAEPRAACATCRWADHCSEVWGATDLINVHRLDRRQRTLLNDQRITTIEQLAQTPDRARPAGVAPATFDRLREQAGVQSGTEPFRLIRPQPRLEGLASIPADDPADIYFDLEGDPFAGDPNLDYLWAFSDTSDAYHFQWAHTPDEERAAFTWFMDILRSKEAAGGDWHVYHYNTYEITSMRRVARQWPHESQRQGWIDEVERIVAARFVDLYRAVEKGVRTQHGSTSLKIVEKLAGYDRAKDAPADAVAKADDSIVAYEQYVMSTDEAVRAELLQGILDYNTHDVRATHAVHGWLRDIAEGLTDDDLIEPTEPYVQSDDTLARIETTARLRDTLRAHALLGDLPSGLSSDGARMLAHMLEWHRAEMVVKYLDLLRLKEWALDEATPDTYADAADGLPFSLEGDDTTESRIRPGTEHESCLLDVELIEIHEPTSTRKGAARQHDFRCRPGSWKIKATSEVDTVHLDEDGKSKTFTISEIDPQEGTFSIMRGFIPEPVGPMVLKPFMADEVIWKALMRVGEQALRSAPDPEFAVSLGLLDQQAPASAAIMQQQGDVDAPARARRIATAMSSGVLPIQGPPGTGKTWLGARLMSDAIAAKKKADGPTIIAVTANSHRVIDNLLTELADHCAAEGIAVAIGHAGRASQVTTDARITRIDSNPKIAGWIDDQQVGGLPLVIGATKYAWAREDMQGLADLLVIDEAGQIALADALAVIQTAPVVVALGDPQQLAAPIQAAHDESVRVSLLEHLAQGADVLPAQVGVFLDRSHRMHGALCAVVADLAYNGQLLATDKANRRNITGPDLTVGGQEVALAPGVAWVPLDGGPEEEVEVTLALVQELIGSAIITLDDGTTTPLTAAEILVVAPHNAHVNRISAAAPDGLRVGTVDKFQGQQGHVVIYSMGRLAESAGDVPFLYEINRLNVALSRARLMAIVVSQRGATFPPVANPEQLMLASRFIRAVT